MMEQFNLLFAVITGIVLLLVLILYFKIHAFIALFITSITVGLLAGLSPGDILIHLQKGMADTLGFVAAVVGLGAMFGAILEHSGGAHALAGYLVNKTGEKRAPWAMGLTGFIVAIPVFFDVAFIILVPMIYALHKRTGKSVLLYGIPLLAGLAISHAFIPPTPGPVAVAEIIGAEMGWVIMTGIAAGLPAAILAGPIFGKFISKRITGNGFYETDTSPSPDSLPNPWMIILMIAIPIVLIIINSVINSPIFAFLNLSNGVKEIIKLLGHPFSALIISILIAWYFLGIRKGYTKDKLLKITGDSLAPAGVIILITGAGGMFKQILSETGAGKMLATTMTSAGMSYLVFAFVVAALVRIVQGSATVAMITSAGLTSSVIIGMDLSELEKALIVTSIASGASILSHVNDSGFWLVSRYFGLTEKETLASWSICTTIIALAGLLFVLLIQLMFA